jgi:hypothetical protein
MNCPFYRRPARTAVHSPLPPGPLSRCPPPPGARSSSPASRFQCQCGRSAIGPVHHGGNARGKPPRASLPSLPAWLEPSSGFTTRRNGRISKPMKLNASQTCTYGRALTALVLNYRPVVTCPQSNPSLWGRSQSIALRRQGDGSPRTCWKQDVLDRVRRYPTVSRPRAYAEL